MEREVIEAIIRRFRRAGDDSARRADQYTGATRAHYVGKAFAYHNCADMLEAFLDHPEWEAGLQALETLLQTYASSETGA